MGAYIDTGPNVGALHRKLPSTESVHRGKQYLSMQAGSSFPGAHQPLALAYYLGFQLEMPDKLSNHALLG